MCLVWKIIGFDKHSNPGPKHLGSFECKNCATFSALPPTPLLKATPALCCTAPPAHQLTVLPAKGEPWGRAGSPTVTF